MVATQPSTVLFLAANPLQVQPLQLGEECRAIENRIRAAKYRDRIRFRSRWAARPDDLLQALNEDAPAVLHFSGHGAGEQGLCFQSEYGSPLCVSADGLGQVMQSAGTSVTVVVLNACFSEVQAQELTDHVPCVIGMSGAIKDEDAIIYAGAFYRALAFGKSVANAHKQGLAALAVHPAGGRIRDVEPAGDAPCSPRPRLLIRHGTDADCIRIVAEPAKKTRCELVIKATLNDFNTDVIARVTELLREITGDLSLEITDIKEGSVRLTISLSPDAAEKLKRLKADGRLDEICGFPVSAFLGSPEKGEMAGRSVQPDADSDAGQKPAKSLEPAHDDKAVAQPWHAQDDSARQQVSHGWGGGLGALLGNYRVVEQLAVGGMGEVWVGRHENLGHRVAVKMLRPEMSRHREMVKRFFNEAQAATAIRNPGIAQVFDFGVMPDGRAYIVMELLEGVSLSTRLKERQLDAVECCRLVRQMANVLQAAHDAGIIHRDLKPDNLFLVPDPEMIGGERVKVLDFGIAKLTGEFHALGMQTRADLVMGTPSYMSPEQCRGANGVDARSDIYSLGCVLFKMVCGRAPFIGHGAGDIIGAQLHVPAPDLRSFAPKAPPSLAALVAKMLEKKPAARPPSMAAVSQALDEILRELGGRPARPSTPLPMPAPRRTSSPLPGLPPVSAPRSMAPPPGKPVATALSSAVAQAPAMLVGSGAAPSAETLPMPVPSPLPWAMPAPYVLSTTSTTLSSSVGMSSILSRGRAKRLTLVFGGLVIIGVAVGIALAALTGDSPSAAKLNESDSPPSPPPVNEVVIDAAVSTASSVADAGSEPNAPMPSGGNTEPEPKAPAEQAPAGVDASECKDFLVDSKWDKLEKCADQLNATDPKLAEELKTRAVEEVKTAPRVAAVEQAIRDRDLKRAQAELDRVWPGSVDLAKLKRKYAQAETQAIYELAAKLEYALSPSCAEYSALLAKLGAAQPPRVTTEAARQVTCTPVLPGQCDAEALAEEGRQFQVAGKLVRALASYEASWDCNKDDQVATRGFMIACNIPSLPKARAFWKRLPAALRLGLVSRCENNKIPQSKLDAP